MTCHSCDALEVHPDASCRAWLTTLRLTKPSACALALSLCGFASKAFIQVAGIRISNIPKDVLRSAVQQSSPLPSRSTAALWAVSIFGMGRAMVSTRRGRLPRLKRKLFNFDLGFSPSGDASVGLFYDRRMEKHRNLENPDHPEQPARVRRIVECLERKGLAQRCKRIPCREATREELELKHTREHVDAMLAIRNLTDEEAIRAGQAYDSVFLCPESVEAALLSAGSVLEATARVCRGEVQSAVCVVRPPGHHAESDCAKGFCIFGNVALAAADARRRAWSARTLVVDFDVHHGNGTQKMFEDDDTVLFCSLHRFDGGTFYPGGEFGNYTSYGVGPGVGYSVNVPWDVEGASKRGDSAPGDIEALNAFDRVFLPIAAEFNPDLVLVSAGFDAAPGDPLGGCQITPEGFYGIIQKLSGLAGGRLVMVLEGGYNLFDNGESMAACVMALLGDQPPASSGGPSGFFMPAATDLGDSGMNLPSVFHSSTVEATRKHLSEVWPSLRPRRP
mmetsp:Transcript_77967/g.215571  ORF Transcript_77967/g.215571 Transcript_77967/m.215571 type:complete len:505 (-) Transcript_77967:254-1768(-)